MLFYQENAAAYTSFLVSIKVYELKFVLSNTLDEATYRNYVTALELN